MGVEAKWLPLDQREAFEQFLSEWNQPQYAGELEYLREENQRLHDTLIRVELVLETSILAANGRKFVWSDELDRVLDGWDD